MTTWRKGDGGPTYNHWGLLDLLLEEWAEQHGLIRIEEDGDTELARAKWLTEANIIPDTPKTI